MSHHIALLRGINVGGKNRLPMSELSAMFEKAGAKKVQTLIQSGNVVCQASGTDSAKLQAVVETALEKRFGHPIPLVMRTADELKKVAKANPWLKKGIDPDWLHVAFLADLPAAAAVAGLDPRRSPPDEFVVVGRDIFLHLPRGVGQTKLSNAWFDSRLSTVSTVRNWRTVLKLLELCSD